MPMQGFAFPGVKLHEKGTLAPPFIVDDSVISHSTLPHCSSSGLWIQAKGMLSSWLIGFLYPQRIPNPSLPRSHQASPPKLAQNFLEQRLEWLPRRLLWRVYPYIL